MNLENELKQLPGKVGFYYKNLSTKEIITYNEGANFSPASIIKLPIIMAVYKMAYQGKISLETQISIKEIEKMPSCGAINSFSYEPELDMKTLCALMITISDNTATNVLINHIGMENLNQEFIEMGLKNTRINRILFDKEASKKNIQNIVTPLEMGDLLEQLYSKQFVSEEVSQEIVDILCRQQINHKLKEMLPPGTRAAHKTGEDDDISNDVGIIYGKEDFIVCYLSNETLPYVFNPFIRKTTKLLFDRCNI